MILFSLELENLSDYPDRNRLPSLPQRDPPQGLEARKGLQYHRPCAGHLNKRRLPLEQAPWLCLEHLVVALWIQRGYKVGDMALLSSHMGV